MHTTVDKITRRIIERSKQNREAYLQRADEAAGGVQMLKSIGGPFPHITFCPTGGVSPENFNDYLALANVACVGGSWIVPSREIERESWNAISALAEKAVTESLK